MIQVDSGDEFHLLDLTSIERNTVVYLIAYALICDANNVKRWWQGEVESLSSSVILINISKYQIYRTALLKL
jgi:hypothetical protein